MFSKKSAATLFAAAAVASAQNVTVGPVAGAGPSGTVINVNLSIDITFTQTFQQICPTGLQPVEYEFSQHCPGGCPPPAPYAVPYGWEVVTTTCNVCGPTPTVVTLTTCPYANATPTPYNGPACPTCYTDVVVYTPVPTCSTCPTPACTTVTKVYPPPSTTPVVPNTVSTYCPPTGPAVPPTGPSSPPAPPATTPATIYTVPSSSKVITLPPPTTYSSACPSCPVTPYTMTSVCPGCPSSYVPATSTAVCPGCPKSTGVIPTPVPYGNMTTPPAYTGAGNKLEMGAGLFLGAAVAIFAML